MQPRPYTPGETPRVLVGRSSELQEVGDFLAPLVGDKEMGGPMLARRDDGFASLLDEALSRSNRIAVDYLSLLRGGA